MNTCWGRNCSKISRSTSPG